MSRSKRKRQGPESAEYDKLKGKLIRIHPQNGAVWVGRLIWVDIYTIGVQFDVSRPEDISIVYKDAIRIDRCRDEEPNWA